MKIEIGQAYRDTSTGFIGIARGYATRGRVDQVSEDCIVTLVMRPRPDGTCGEVRRINASVLIPVPESLVA